MIGHAPRGRPCRLGAVSHPPCWRQRGRCSAGRGAVRAAGHQRKDGGAIGVSGLRAHWGAGSGPSGQSRGHGGPADFRPRAQRCAHDGVERCAGRAPLAARSVVGGTARCLDRDASRAHRGAQRQDFTCYAEDGSTIDSATGFAAQLEEMATRFDEQRLHDICDVDSRIKDLSAHYETQHARDKRELESRILEIRSRFEDQHALLATNLREQCTQDRGTMKEG